MSVVCAPCANSADLRTLARAPSFFGARAQMAARALQALSVIMRLVSHSSRDVRRACHRIRTPRAWIVPIDRPCGPWPGLWRVGGRVRALEESRQHNARTWLQRRSNPKSLRRGRWRPPHCLRGHWSPPHCHGRVSPLHSLRRIHSGRAPPRLGLQNGKQSSTSFCASWAVVVMMCRSPRLPTASRLRYLPVRGQPARRQVRPRRMRPNHPTRPMTSWCNSQCSARGTARGLPSSPSACRATSLPRPPQPRPGPPRKRGGAQHLAGTRRGPAQRAARPTPRCTLRARRRSPWSRRVRVRVPKRGGEACDL